VGIILTLIIGFVTINPIISDPERTKFQDISHLVNKLIEGYELNEDEYKLVSKQTGLCKSSILKLNEKYNYSYLLKYQEDHINNIEYNNKPMFIGLIEEELKVDHLPFVDLQPGDILITSSNHTLGIRFGHVGLVIDGERGLTIESYTPGDPSDYDFDYTWNDYPKVMVLRLKEEYRHLIPEIVNYADNYLLNVPYSIFASTNQIIDINRSPKITQCAHLVWAAYKAVGIDLNSDGGWLVTGQDISRSKYLEVAEVKGYDFDKLW
jgi:uncharacterized protein YycO